MQTTNEILLSSVRHVPDKLFIDDGERQITYQMFDKLCCQLANVLADQGIVQGSTVGIYLPSCAELAVGYHACQKLGAIAVPMSSMYQAREINDIAKRTEMTVIITDGAGAGVACGVRDGLPSLQHVLVHGSQVQDATSLHGLLAEASNERDTVQCRPEDVAVLFFTSGTTGKPKGAMQTHGSIHATLRDMEVYNRFRSAKETILGVLPIFNNFGATCLMMGTLYNGGTLLLHHRWDTERVLADISRARVTFMAGTPTMFIYMWKSFDPDRHDLSSLRLCVTGGAPVAPEALDACKNNLGLNVTQVYGATETSGYITGDPVVGVRKRGSAGPSFGSSDVRILDDDGKEMPPGEVGEVVISGDTIGAGYWRDKETTRTTFTADGWRSGDLGHLDEDGYLFIADRKKDLIISGGFNIYPIEVEDVLYKHPKVEMCAVVGIVDEVKGELPVAFVVTCEDPTSELGEELRIYCREQMAAYKCPRHVQFISEMPLGPSGKILKRKLRNIPVQISSKADQ